MRTIYVWISVCAILGAIFAVATPGTSAGLTPELPAISERAAPPEKCVGDKFNRWCVAFESDGSLCVSREGGDFPIRQCVPTRQTTAAALDVRGVLEECNASTVTLACVGYSDGKATVCYQPSPGNLDPPAPVCKSVGPAVKPVTGCIGGDIACWSVSGSGATLCYTTPGHMDPPPPVCYAVGPRASDTIETPCYALDAGVAEIRGCSSRPVHVNPVDTCVREPTRGLYVCTQADAATGACVSLGAPGIRIEPSGACVSPEVTGPAAAGASSPGPCVGAREEAHACYYSDDSGQNCAAADLRAAGAASACWNFIARTASACADPADHVAADERCAALRDLLTSSAGVYVTEQVCTPQAVKTARVCWTTIGLCLEARADGEVRGTCLLPEEGAGTAAAIPDRMCKSDKWGGEIYRVCVDTRTPCASVALGFDTVVDTCLHPATSTTASGAGGVSKCTPTLIPMSPHPQTCVRYAGVNDFCVTSTGTAGKDVAFCVVYVGPVIW